MDVGDHEVGGSWMTYREIAAARRVKLAAAVRLVQRHKWRRQTGNDGTARIFVPIEWTKPSDRVPPDIVHDVAPDAEDDVADDVTPDRGILAGALAALEAALMEANKRADAAQVLAERTLAELADANARAERALAEERLRADRSSERADTLQAEIRQAEARFEAERGRADALRTSIDELKAGQELMTDMHAAELASTQDRLERVRDAAEALRQAEAARKARGRLRRAWDGWRGR